MNKNEVYSVRIDSIDAKAVPGMIQEQFSLLRQIRERVAKAVNSAYSVKKTVVDQVGGKPKGTKESIENINKAAITIANAQVDAMTAQQISFEYQQKLAEITKFLFGLGLTNITMNRVIVKELELKLREASEGELDELARSELESLLKQLKAQQDIDQKQRDLEERVKEQHKIIQELQDRLEKQEKILSEYQVIIDNLSKK